MTALREAAAKLVAGVKTAELIREIQLSDEEARPKSENERRQVREEKRRQAVELRRGCDSLVACVDRVEPVVEALEEYAAAVTSRGRDRAAAYQRLGDAIIAYVKSESTPARGSAPEGWARP